MELVFKNVNLINLALRWFKLLVTIQIVAILISIVFSSPVFIKPYFKSWAVVYPSNTTSYSDESLSEQMVQILNANQIRDSLIKQFSLWKHYQIDSTNSFAQTKMNRIYNRNVSVSKTLADAVQIQVTDTDPVQAKLMVDAIIKGYELKIKTLHEKRYGQTVGMWSRAVERKLTTIDSLKTRLHTLATREGLIDFDAQSAEIVKGYLGTVEGGLTKVDKKRVEELKKRMDEKGGELILVMDRLKYENGLLTGLIAAQDKAIADLDRQETYVDVIESAYVADKKCRPIRWIIVLGSMLAAALLSFTALVVFEGIELKKN
jgi:capsule polysaccharide export protein KpsE/RkpR